jgi:chemotaxis protein CheD
MIYDSSSTFMTVGIAELKVATYPIDLSVIGLGSCIGICLYDPLNKIGGIAHVMLPDSTKSRDSVNKAKFGDTAVEALFAEMIFRGALARNIVAKIAGGAKMFHTVNECSPMEIGDRNACAVRSALQLSYIPLLAEDCGGHDGRSIRLEIATGAVYIKTINSGGKII